MENRIHVSDARTLGFCIKGCIRFAEKHDLDFNQFTSEGIPFEQVMHINSPGIRKLIAEAKRRGATDGIEET